MESIRIIKRIKTARFFVSMEPGMNILAVLKDYVSKSEQPVYIFKSTLMNFGLVFDLREFFEEMLLLPPRDCLFFSFCWEGTHKYPWLDLDLKQQQFDDVSADVSEEFIISSAISNWVDAFNEVSQTNFTPEDVRLSTCHRGGKRSYHAILRSDSEGVACVFKSVGEEKDFVKEFGDFLRKQPGKLGVFWRSAPSEPDLNVYSKGQAFRLLGCGKTRDDFTPFSVYPPSPEPLSADVLLQHFPIVAKGRAIRAVTMPAGGVPMFRRLSIMHSIPSVVASSSSSLLPRPVVAADLMHTQMPSLDEDDPSQAVEEVVSTPQTQIVPLRVGRGNGRGPKRARNVLQEITGMIYIMNLITYYL